ncbi:MAG: D-glycero-beta-D-manno-heptose 1,7-bisphosphate 7-phosphatase [Magnetococcales bacterium]|nr:D-glycero-beta-D-manno-heptose 1,7-bisphosphate 7-phosphatase [Magnetococcales bacterium]
MYPTKQAVILAGGAGTRLGALTRQVPKPLLPVGGRPFLEHLVWNLSRHGIRDIVLSCGYLGEQIVDHFNSNQNRKRTVRAFVEPEPLGTGGALLFLAAELQEHFFLLNGDSLFDINYLDLPLAATDPEWASATLALRAVPDAARYGRVEIHGTEVVAFREKEADPHPGLINAGIAWMDRRLLESLPAGVSSLERELFPRLVQERRLFGKPYRGYFIDMGIPVDYAQADQDLTHWQRRRACFFDRDGVINIDHGYVHTPDRFEWVAGAPQAIRWCNEQGYLVIIVTNQAGIARGYYDEAAFQRLTAWMEAELASLGAHVDAVYHCPHHPTAGLGALRMACSCRKPNPGLLEQAMSEWEIDRSGSLLIGDKPSDLAAAAAAGVVGHLFAGGRLDHFLFETMNGSGQPA